MGTGGSTGADVSMSDNTTTRAITWLTAWDSQGAHRTATVGDQAGADWLIREAAGLGAAPEVETFALDRLDPIDVYVEFGSTRIPGVPVFDAPATGADGVAGTLGPIEAEPGIAVAELSPRSVYTPDYEKLRRHAGHHGLVIVCEGAQPGLGLLNAERFRDPYGAPAIHVSSEASDTVLAASARRVSARLVTASSRTPAEACNVVVTIKGQDRARAPVVIMTPRSLLVAIDCGARGRACLLARIAARPGRLSTSMRCDLHRQQRPRARSSGSRRFHYPPPGLGAACRRRRCGLGPLWSQYRRGRG
jgi:hypothetical protein